MTRSLRGILMGLVQEVLHSGLTLRFRSVAEVKTFADPRSQHDLPDVSSRRYGLHAHQSFGGSKIAWSVRHDVYRSLRSDLAILEVVEMRKVVHM